MTIPIENPDYIAPGGGGEALGVIVPEAIKTISLDTTFVGVDHAPRQLVVTPEWGGAPSISVSKVLISELSKAMGKSFSWKPNKLSKTEMENPHPLKSHLQSAYSEQSLKATICGTYPNLEELWHAETIKDYPISMRLFLYALCAMISGLPSTYTGDPWEIVAETWCSSCSKEDMEAGCAGAIEDFLALHKENMDEEREDRMYHFVQQCTWSLNWQREKKKGKSQEDPLPKYLKETYSMNDPFFAYVFGHRPDPSNWDYETAMFLFAVAALIARSTNRPFVLEVVAGCKNITSSGSNHTPFWKTFRPSSNHPKKRKLGQLKS